MSSTYVRDNFESFLTTNLPTETQVDLTGEFDNLQSLLSGKGINRKDTWLGLQYIGSEEIPITISATNTRGKYREVGVIYLHVVAPAVVGGVKNAIQPRTEAIRNALRGQRIGAIRIDSVSPPNYQAGATLKFEGGWYSASIIVAYEYDIDL